MLKVRDQQWELEHFVNIVILALVFIKAHGYALYNDTSLLRIFTLKFVTLLLKKVMTVPSGTLRAAHCLTWFLGFCVSRLTFLGWSRWEHTCTDQTSRLTPSQGPHLLPPLVKLRQRRASLEQCCSQLVTCVRKEGVAKTSEIGLSSFSQTHCVISHVGDHDIWLDMQIGV